MESVVHRNLRDEGLEVVLRDGRLYLRYDAGAHQVAWREDEITDAELVQMRRGGQSEYRVILAVQKRIRASGEDPNSQNWTPQ
jgi:hypothetical protein